MAKPVCVISGVGPAATDQIRASDQPQDRERTWARHSDFAASTRRA